MKTRAALSNSGFGLRGLESAFQVIGIRLPWFCRIPTQSTPGIARRVIAGGPLSLYEVAFQRQCWHFVGRRYVIPHG